jgi:hypothetical protein
MLAWLLAITINSHACTPAQDFQISCRNYCYMSWNVKVYQIVKGKCHCSIEEDINQKLNLVPKNGWVSKEKKHYDER